MSAGSTQTGSSGLKKQAQDDSRALAAFERLRRKATVVIVGTGLAFVGMAIAITDADQTLFQKATGAATFALLLGLVFFAWHIRKDAGAWVGIFRLRARLAARQLKEQEVSQTA